MTINTTNDKSSGFLSRWAKRPRSWITIILGVSLLLHVVSWFALQPLGETTMAFSVAEEAQRTAEVETRERERREAERLARQDRPLDQEQSEKLKREAERKQKREIAERVKQLAEMRQAIEAVRQETFEQLSERSAQDMSTLAGDELERALAELERMVRWIAEHPDGGSGENDLFIGTAVGLRDGVAALPENPGAVPQQVQPLVDDAKRLVGDLYRGRDRRAAELAMAENTSFTDAQEMLNASSPQRPDLAGRLSGQPQTVGELGTLRQALDEAVGQAQDMATRGQAMLAQAQGLSERNAQQGGNRYARQAMMGRAVRGQSAGVVDLTVMMQGFGRGETRGMSADTTGEGANMAQGRAQEAIRLAEDQVLAKAMPGRMFTQTSDRAGWLYLDTWYVIGPWENNGQIDFDRRHPPQWGIDFDATYTDGKFADQPDHADHRLRWQFVQADHIRVEPPRVFGGSTYYAFTEVYFDHDRDMLIAIASDDAAQMWVNDDLVWADYGQSPWQLGEGYRRVRFHKGFNKVLVRIENGPGKCVWSVLLCPPEATGL